MKLQILECFKGLEFEETQHKYFFNSKPISISVSGLIKKFYKEFDSYTISLKIAERDGLNQEDILKEWEDAGKVASERGNKAHIFGENYCFDKTLKPSDKLEEAIVSFWNKVPEHIIPIIMELKMFHKKYMFAGTADILLYDTINKTFIIGDYKTNRDLFKNFQNKKMLGVFNNLLDTPFNHYQLQLSFYQILFEQTGFKVSSRKLVWLLDDGTYKMYDMKDYTQELKEQLKIMSI